MPNFQLLGGLSIETGNGPLTGPAIQRHRLALMALLATARPGGVARDKLLAYLWPERDTGHARNLLNQAVHALRKALGEAALLSVGDEIRLDPRAVRVDVVEFGEALEARDLARAVELYRGPFLDGFFLPDALEFERWVDGERARLRERYRDALEGLARAAGEQGDRGGAVGWWRRLAGEDPSSSRVALELMRALEAAGERADAIRQARVHAALLEQEFGAEPDPAVAALAERMRTEPEAERDAERWTAPGTRPVGDRHAGRAAASEQRREAADPEAGRAPVDPEARRAAAPPGKVAVLALLVVLLAAGTYLWTRMADPGSDASPPYPASPPEFLPAPEDRPAASIAVLAFDDLTLEGDQAWFADGIAEEILTALTGIEGLRVSARQSSFAFRGRQTDVRRIGDTLGVATVLEGSVRKGGDSVWVTAQLIDTETGFHRWSETYAKVPTAENLRAIQSEIAREVARALELRFAREPDAAAGSPADATYGLYLEGRSLLRRAQTEFGEEELLRRDEVLRSVDLFRQVVARSPDWAPGWAELGEALRWVASGSVEHAAHYAASKAALERALELDPKLTRAHASLASVLRHWDRDPREAEARYRHALSLGGEEAWGGYAMLLRSTGRYGEAIDAYRRAEAHDPLSLFLKQRLLGTYVCAERFEEAIAYAERSLALDRGLWPLWSLALALERSGRLEEALARIDEVPSPQRWDLARSLLYARADRPEEARTRLGGVDEQYRAAGPGYDQILAALHVALGEPEAAIAVLEGLAGRVNRGFVFDCRYPELRELEPDPRYEALVERIASRDQGSGILSDRGRDRAP